MKWAKVREKTKKQLNLDIHRQGAHGDNFTFLIDPDICSDLL